MRRKEKNKILCEKKKKQLDENSIGFFFLFDKFSVALNRHLKSFRFFIQIRKKKKCELFKMNNSVGSIMQKNVPTHQYFVVDF